MWEYCVHRGFSCGLFTVIYFFPLSIILPCPLFNACMYVDSDETLGARYEAASMFINHHEIVVRDALRGLGELENQELHDQVDLAFRFAMKALIDGEGQANLHDVVSKKVAEAARYQRKRVCVPRDMSANAARQFQGAMNWLISCVETEK